MMFFISYYEVCCSYIVTVVTAYAVVQCLQFDKLFLFSLNFDPIWTDGAAWHNCFALLQPSSDFESSDSDQIFTVIFLQP